MSIATKVSTLGLCLTILALSAVVARADRGVGVNLGHIAIEDRLAPGGGYRLPSLGVINTGDEAGDYEVAISYLQDQAERRPPAGWFELEPRRFFLEAGGTQSVGVRLILPTGAEPGDYFALLEAHPVPTGDSVSIGIAAATKVSFSVKPSSWLQAQRVQINRWLDESEPWSYLVPGSLLGGLLFMMLGRRVRLRLPFEWR